MISAQLGTTRLSQTVVGLHTPHEANQTLWDLRTALGSRLTQSLVTRAMELSPAAPSFLDMRNAILHADTVVNGGRAHDTIWKVFANRGMGYFAAALSGDDTEPAEDFSLPPGPDTPVVTLTGKVSSWTRRNSSSTAEPTRADGPVHRSVGGIPAPGCRPRAFREIAR